MAQTLNIRRDVSDPFYRYKMERIQSKIEGKGNGIKTVIPNLPSIAQSLARPPAYVLKFFGFELGAQTNQDLKDDRWIINGAHDAAKLQDHLDGFINKFVLCKQCKNPETDLKFKDGRILLDCKACGQRTEADLRHKLSSFILKDAKGSKGKKDKATKKADRKARREAEAENGSVNGARNGSPQDSNSDNADDLDEGIEAGSDDELTRRINDGAKDIDVADSKVEWSVDTSEAAVAARAKELPSDFKRNLTLDDDDEEGGEGSAYDAFGTWILEEGEKAGGVAELDNAAIGKKAQEFGIEKKHKTMTVLAQTLFTDKVVQPKNNEIEERAPLLQLMMKDSERHQKAFLGGIERFIEKNDLVAKTSIVLIKLYQEDLLDEALAKQWGAKASKKYVDLATSKKIRLNAKQFFEWLENAESDEESEEDE